MKFTIITKNNSHNSCQKGGSRIIAEAKPRTGDIITAEVEDSQDGSYTASFVPTQPGEVEITVTINGECISMYPLKVQILHHTTLDKPSKIENDDGKMGHPWGIAFGKDGVWAITDQCSNCVCLFDNKDQLIRKFGSEGSENSQFSNPFGISFDANNNLYVVDFGNNRVQKFDINGSYLLELGNKGSSDSQLSNPLGITVYNDRVFVADNCISVFQCDGQFSHTFGSDQLRNPHDVAVTNDNQVLVAEWSHESIFVFTLNGNYVSKVDTLCSHLNNPCGMDIDLYGFIFVTEYGQNRISIFNKNGIFIHCFRSGDSCNTDGFIPRGIACSPNRWCLRL